MKRSLVRETAAPFVSDPDFTLWLGDVRDVLPALPAESVDCCVTSPPYWGLRDYGADGQLGLEASPEAYVAGMVAVFADVRRLLKPTGSLWLNLGDSYASNGGNDAAYEATREVSSISSVEYAKRGQQRRQGHGTRTGLKPKDLVGIPWRVALALQADGWYLRADVIWSKPNPMPESVTDRPTKAHEYVFLLTKSPRYFYDAAAIAEPAKWERWGDQTVGPGSNPNGWIQPKSKRELMGEADHRYAGLVGQSWAKRKAAGATRGNVAFDGNVGAGTQRGVHGEGVSHDLGNGLTRNARSVWEIQTQPYPDAHFAVFPEDLPRRCILAGCPEWVCATCGKPRERLVEKAPNIHPGASHDHTADLIGHGAQRNADGIPAGTIMRQRFQAGRDAETIGWSDCGCGAGFTPGGVLDPFMGSGTTALVARKHGRRSVGVELNPEYAEMAARRLGQQSLLAEGA